MFKSANPFYYVKKKIEELRKIEEDKAKKKANRLAFLIKESISYRAPTDKELSTRDCVGVVKEDKKYRVTITNPKTRYGDDTNSLIAIMENGTFDRLPLKPIYYAVRQFESEKDNVEQKEYHPENGMLKGEI